MEKNGRILYRMDEGDKYAGVTAPGNSRLKGAVLRLNRDHPEDVERLVENADGSIYAWIPVEYIKIRRPPTISEEARKAKSESMKKVRRWTDAENKDT